MIWDWLQRSNEPTLPHVIAAEQKSLLTRKVLSRIQSFAQLLRFGLLGKHSGHSWSCLLGILFVTLWLAEAVRVIVSPDPSTDEKFPQIFQKFESVALLDALTLAAYGVFQSGY